MNFYRYRIQKQYFRPYKNVRIFSVQKRECYVLFKRTEKNAKNVTFFCKERKRTQKEWENVPFFCIQKRERYVLFRSFFEFLATYETQKNAKNVTFFLKERKRTRERFVLLQKERENIPFFFLDIYRNIYRYI